MHGAWFSEQNVDGLELLAVILGLSDFERLILRAFTYINTQIAFINRLEIFGGGEFWDG